MAAASARALVKEAMEASVATPPDWPRAASLAAEAASTDPRNVNALLLLGRAETERGDYDRAAATLRRAMAIAQEAGNAAAVTQSLKGIAGAIERNGAAPDVVFDDVLWELLENEKGRKGEGDFASATASASASDDESAVRALLARSTQRRVAAGRGTEAAAATLAALVDPGRAGGLPSAARGRCLLDVFNATLPAPPPVPGQTAVLRGTRAAPHPALPSFASMAPAAAALEAYRDWTARAASAAASIGVALLDLVLDAEERSPLPASGADIARVVDRALALWARCAAARGPGGARACDAAVDTLLPRLLAAIDASSGACARVLHGVRLRVALAAVDGWESAGGSAWWPTAGVGAAAETVAAHFATTDDGRGSGWGPREGARERGAAVAAALAAGRWVVGLDGDAGDGWRSTRGLAAARAAVERSAKRPAGLAPADRHGRGGIPCARHSTEAALRCAAGEWAEALASARTATRELTQRGATARAIRNDLGDAARRSLAARHDLMIALLVEGRALLGLGRPADAACVALKLEGGKTVAKGAGSRDGWALLSRILALPLRAEAAEALGDAAGAADAMCRLAEAIKTDDEALARALRPALLPSEGETSASANYDAATDAAVHEAARALAQAVRADADAAAGGRAATDALAMGRGADAARAAAAAGKRAQATGEEITRLARAVGRLPPTFSFAPARAAVAMAAVGLGHGAAGAGRLAVLAAEGLALVAADVEVAGDKARAAGLRVRAATELVLAADAVAGPHTADAHARLAEAALVAGGAGRDGAPAVTEARSRLARALGADPGHARAGPLLVAVLLGTAPGLDAASVAAATANPDAARATASRLCRAMLNRSPRAAWAAAWLGDAAEARAWEAERQATTLALSGDAAEAAAESAETAQVEWREAMAQRQTALRALGETSQQVDSDAVDDGRGGGGGGKEGEKDVEDAAEVATDDGDALLPPPPSTARAPTPANAATAARAAGTDAAAAVDAARLCWEGLARAYEALGRGGAALLSWERACALGGGRHAYCLAGRAAAALAGAAPDADGALRWFEQAAALGRSPEDAGVALMGAATARLAAADREGARGAPGRAAAELVAAADAAAAAARALPSSAAVAVLRGEIAAMRAGRWASPGALAAERADLATEAAEAFLAALALVEGGGGMESNGAPPPPGDPLRHAASLRASAAHALFLRARAWREAPAEDVEVEAVLPSSPSRPAPAEDLARARALVLAALEASPADPALWRGLGAVASTEGERECALSRSLQLDPASAEGWAALSRVYGDAAGALPEIGAEAERLEGLAAACRERARGADPTDPGAWEAAAAAATRTRRRAAEAGAVAPPLGAGPGDAADIGRHAAAMAPGAEGCLAEAAGAAPRGRAADGGTLGAAGRAVALDPAGPAAWTALGHALEGRGRSEDAAAAHARAAALLAARPALVGGTPAPDAAGRRVTARGGPDARGVGAPPRLLDPAGAAALNVARSLCRAGHHRASIAAYRAAFARLRGPDAPPSSHPDPDLGALVALLEARGEPWALAGIACALSGRAHAAAASSGADARGAERAAARAALPALEAAARAALAAGPAEAAQLLPVRVAARIAAAHWTDDGDVDVTDDDNSLFSSLGAALGGALGLVADALGSAPARWGPGIGDGDGGGDGDGARVVRGDLGSLDPDDAAARARFCEAVQEAAGTLAGLASALALPEAPDGLSTAVVGPAARADAAALAPAARELLESWASTWEGAGLPSPGHTAERVRRDLPRAEGAAPSGGAAPGRDGLPPAPSALGARAAAARAAGFALARSGAATAARREAQRWAHDAPWAEAPRRAVAAGGAAAAGPGTPGALRVPDGAGPGHSRAAAARTPGAGDAGAAGRAAGRPDAEALAWPEGRARVDPAALAGAGGGAAGEGGAFAPSAAARARARDGDRAGAADAALAGTAFLELVLASTGCRPGEEAGAGAGIGTRGDHAAADARRALATALHARPWDGGLSLAVTMG